MKPLLSRIRACTICEAHLPLGSRPVLKADPTSKIVIIGQAPGTVVHETGIPWNDKSGERLREWLEVDLTTFYDPEQFAIIPMGFCYPGKGLSGDLPPRKECAPTWHDLLWQELKEVQLTLLVGAYAQSYYLHKRRGRTLTETVKNFSRYLPDFFPLPHPSPRNNIWLKKNKWFEAEVIPELRHRVKRAIRN
ncbi:MAG: uracil-DNA glycosylase family protein [Bacteroidota bacterium]